MAAIRRQGAPVDADLVIDAGAVITADASAPVLRDASIVIVDGAIAAVGPTAEIRSAWHGRNTLDARRDIVTPGFIDSHVHLSHHLGRTSIPDVWPESREHDHWLPYWRNLSEEDQYQSTLLACLEMVRNGTTTFCDMSGRHDASVSAAAADEVGMRGMVSEVCWDIPPYQEVAIGDTEACVARLERLIERFPMAPDKRIWAGVGMTGMGKCSDTLVTAGRELARRHGLVMYMHQSFGEADVVAFRAMAGGVTATEHLRDLDVLGPDLMLIHMVRTEKPEVDLLASTGTSVVHCPGASVRWGMGVSRFGRLPEMVERGVTIALGCDSGNYSDAFDITHQAYLAATIHREARGGTPIISAAHAFEMATMGGARAMGIADLVGSIEPGKRADIVVHDGQRPEWHPLHDPVASLIYAARSSSVRDVIIDGRLVLKGGEFTTIDEEAAYRSIDRHALDLSRRMGWESFATRI